MHKTRILALATAITVVVWAMFLSGCVEKNGTPPGTVLAGPPAGEDWIGENTIFTLTATDYGSGVNATYYRTWYNNVWSSWIVYTSPFNLSGEGEHRIEFFSDDNVGNVEQVQNVTYYLDSTPPETVITVEEPVGTLYVGKIMFDGNQTVECTKLVITPGSGTVIHCKAINISSGNIEYLFTDEYVLSM